MTDEEKDKTEKEYKEWLVHDHKLLDNPTYCDIEQKCFRAFFAGTRYGLVEGRKESEKEIAELKEQNMELKEKCERKTKALVKLIEQIEKLTCGKKYYCCESDGKSVPCFMTKLCADCQYREPKE